MKLCRYPHSLAATSRLCLDHSHGPRARASYLAALPSTRAIETRLLPSSLAATHRGFAFYVGFPKRSIPSIATCLSRKSLSSIADYAVFAALSWVTYTNANRVKHKREYISLVIRIERVLNASGRKNWSRYGCADLHDGT